MHEGPRGQRATAYFVMPWLCLSQALNIRRVALLFLSRGNLYHADTWANWLGSISSMLPIEAACSVNSREHLQQLCGRQANRLVGRKASPDERNVAWATERVRVIKQQHLFSVYIHSGPEITGERARPCTQLPRRVDFEGFRMQQRACNEVKPSLFAFVVTLSLLRIDADLDPLWRGRLIADRIVPEWGTHR